ncbi:DNA-binding response regulator (plasmid) [Rhizobium sp. ACO-34A]|nr:response regulator [Rhizobium sp. ACO-34A]ATN36897.1 DNA-binding response regulator [Rhizobium sp. ACO-34A]
MNENITESAPEATLLVVDDDIRIRSMLAANLGAKGYRVLTAASASEMRGVLQTNGVDVVILDIMMPGENGLSACRRLEEEGGPPVILLSALGEETDRILGLDSGAERYLPKPCSSHEVLAHVRSILRKQRKTGDAVHQVLAFSDYRVNLDTHELHNHEGALIDLSEGEFSVLRVFVTRPRRVLSRSDLLVAARGPDTDSFDRAIDVQVSRLRRKLKDQEGALIRTIRNEGYMFMAPVSAHTH